jgi:hypothetical protein
VNPSIISLSFTISSFTVMNAVVPPTVIFPLTLRFELIFVVPLTVRPLKTGLSVSVIVAPTPDAVAIRFPLTKLISFTLPAVPTRDPSSRIEIPKIRPSLAPETP